MKKLFFALLIAVLGFGASALTTNQKLDTYWFEVDPSDSQTILNPSTPMAPPSGSCDANNVGPRCSVELTTPIAPSTVSQAQTNETYVSSAFIEEE